MPSLVSDSDKEAYRSALIDLFDTFKRPIKIIKFEKRTIISTNPNYNFLYNDKQVGSEVRLEKKEIIVDAVIRYGKEQKFSFSSNVDAEKVVGSDIRVRTEDGYARIKVKADGKAYLDNAEIVELDGISFRVDGPPRPHLTFGSEFYTFTVKRVT